MLLIFICFDSIQIFQEIASLSFQVSWRHQFLTDLKKDLDFVFFPLGLSSFWVGAWFPFDEGQFIGDVLFVYICATLRQNIQILGRVVYLKIIC